MLALYTDSPESKPFQGWVNVVGAEAEVAFCLNYDCPEAELERRCDCEVVTDRL